MHQPWPRYPVIFLFSRLFQLIALPREGISTTNMHYFCTVCHEGGERGAFSKQLHLGLAVFKKISEKSFLPVQTRPIRSRWRRFFEETMLFSVWEVSVAKWHWVISVLTFPPTWCSSTWSPPAPIQESGSVGRTNYEQFVKKITPKRTHRCARLTGLTGLTRLTGLT